MKILSILVLLFIILVGGFYVLRSDSPERAEESRGESLPNLSFADLDGNPVSLSEFSGTPLVVNSWAVWCPFCKEELKAFAQVQEEMGESVVIVAIDRAESQEKVEKFLEEEGIRDSLVFLMDPTDSFYKSIGGFSMPETLFVDKNGIIRHHKRGPMNADEIRDHIESLIQ